jgi:hypothetical protein
MEWPIPARAQEMLRARLAARQQAEAELAAAVQLVLAAVGAPEDAQVVVNADGSMLVKASDNNALLDEMEGT